MADTTEYKSLARGASDTAEYRSLARGASLGPTNMTWDSVMTALVTIRRETLSETELALLDPLISILSKIEGPAKDRVRYEASQPHYRSQSKSQRGWGMQVSPRTRYRQWLAPQ